MAALYLVVRKASELAEGCVGKQRMAVSSHTYSLTALAAYGCPSCAGAQWWVDQRQRNNQEGARLLMVDQMGVIICPGTKSKLGDELRETILKIKRTC
jgi:hypothetical protein